MNIDFYDMKQSDDFPGIGKKLPYREPVGFFDGLSEKTLEMARLRGRRRTKRLILLRSFAAAASLAAIVFLGFLILEKEPTKNERIASQKKIEIPVVEEQKKSISEQSVAAEVKHEKVEESTFKSLNNEEDVNDVLADLSDEELMQLAAMYKADPFIEEAVQ